jgi:hypothetical protein
MRPLTIDPRALVWADCSARELVVVSDCPTVFAPNKKRATAATASLEIRMSFLSRTGTPVKACRVYQTLVCFVQISNRFWVDVESGPLRGPAPPSRRIMECGDLSPLFYATVRLWFEYFEMLRGPKDRHDVISALRASFVLVIISPRPHGRGYYISALRAIEVEVHPVICTCSANPFPGHIDQNR